MNSLETLQTANPFLLAENFLLAQQFLLAQLFLLADLAHARIWYLIPLVVVVSLVYGATRHEYLHEIFVQAMRTAVWILGFMAMIFVVIWVSGYWN